MGAIESAMQKVRTILARDKDKVAIQLARGATSSGAITGSGRDMLQVFGYDAIASYLNVENDLMSRFADYEEMDDEATLSTSLDIYGDDSTQPDLERRRTIWCVSPDRTIEELLDRDLFQRTLRADEEAWTISRGLCKYGNDYEEILINESGVVGLNFLPAATIRRIEGPRGELYGFVQDFRGKYGYTPGMFKDLLVKRKAGQTPHANLQNMDWQRPDRTRAIALEDWEVVHFRLHGRVRRSVYGHSVFEPARWLFKRLMLLEDAATIYRLQRAPERYAFYVDVGNLPPGEALAYTNKVRQMYKKKRFYNPNTGRLDLRWEPLTQDDDIWIPMSKDGGTRVEVLGAPAWQHMDDIEYFRDKMFAAIKIPKAYLAQEQGVARQVLSSEDVRFARTILRVQQELKNGFGRICRLHLAALGLNPYAVPYEVQMTVPSAIFELANMEVRNARADFANRMQAFVSQYWILSHVFEMSDGEIQEIIKQRQEEAERQGDLETGMQIKAQTAMNTAFPPEMQAAQAGAQKNGAQPTPQAGTQKPSSPAAQEAFARAANEYIKQLSQGPKNGNGHHRPASHLHPWRTFAISEQELFAGNREHEKRAEQQLEKLLQNDRQMAKQLREVSGLIGDLRSAMGRLQH
jgi:hypothetical protein